MLHANLEGFCLDEFDALRMMMEKMAEGHIFRVKSSDQLEFVLDDMHQREHLSQALLNILPMSKTN